MPIDNRAGDTETGSCGLMPFLCLAKQIDHFDQGSKITAGKLLLPPEFKPAIGLLIECQIGFGAAYVAC
jgi:hypothetical protein